MEDSKTALTFLALLIGGLGLLVVIGFLLYLAAQTHISILIALILFLAWVLMVGVIKLNDMISWNK